MKLKKFAAAVSAALMLAVFTAAPALAADEIEVNDDISVSGDYDWTRFANDHITLNVYNNGLYISDGSDDSVNVVSAFEDLTGIKVNYTTYDSNESLYAKLKSGGVSYDVIFPSDYMVGKMINEGMLAELDMDNIPNIAGVGETYLDRSFDPGNKYSVPYMWGTTGLIYNTTMVEEPPTKWADMWDVEYTNNVLMFNNSRDAYAIAAKVAGLSMNPQSVDEITAITEKLKEQKNIVQAYVMDEVFDKMEGGEAAMAPYYAGDAITMIDENPDLYTLFIK
jgi:spermidine/putrescine transport system substrate-binding protein